MFLTFFKLLTNNQLLHLFPFNIISCFMSDGNCDPPLNALWSPEKAESTLFC